MFQNFIKKLIVAVAIEE